MSRPAVPPISVPAGVLSSEEYNVAYADRDESAAEEEVFMGLSGPAVPEDYPLYSEQARCQDCYRCLRHCPEKAIRVSGGHARVAPERCLLCGRCLSACPAGAKKVRDDLPSVRQLLKARGKVVLSLAPSWAGEFADLDPSRMVAACRRLGFASVGETAAGAEAVSARIAALLASGGIWLTTACPVAVEWVFRHRADLVPRLTPVEAPLLAHARQLREADPGVRVVFAGPCVAKKRDASRHDGLLAAALTFSELRKWMEEEGIDPSGLVPAPRDRFLPGRRGPGALYPLEGGVMPSLLAAGAPGNVRVETVAGLPLFGSALAALTPEWGGEPLLVELLACEGGCVGGPGGTRGTDLAARLAVRRHAEHAVAESGGIAEAAREEVPECRVPLSSPCPEEDVRAVLQRVGKSTASDELDCGGCGYESCRDFARSVLAGMSETAMCVTYNRQLARNQSSALLRTMPFGVVITDGEGEILECNEAFARLFGEEIEALFAVVPGLRGARLDSVLPFSGLFHEVIQTGQEVVRRSVHLPDGRILSVSVFCVEPGRVAGGILLDVTGVESRREHIVEKARQVIAHNLATVQDIALRLGRSAAQSEAILSTIIEGFSETTDPEEGENPGGDLDYPST